MSNRVRKVIFNSLCNIGKIESWFEDMASKGLHFKGIERYCAVFEKGKPLKTIYRIGVFSEAPSMEQLDEYKKRGWDFAACRGDFYVFSSSEESDPLEFYVAPAEQGHALEKSEKDMRKSLLITLIASILGICTALPVFFLDKVPFLSIVEGDYIGQVFFISALAFTLISEICNYAAFSTLKKSLMKGKPVNHRKDWRKGRIINGTALILIMAMALFVITIPILKIVKNRSYTLPEAEYGLPIIRLSEIEHNQNLKRSVMYDTRGIDWDNKVSCSWSPLAPIQYEVNEHGIVSGQLWEDGSGEYSPSIETHYYRLVFPKMANALMNSLMDKYLYFTRSPIKKIENTKFDAFYTVERNIRKQIFAYSGDKVIYISYYGKKDMKSLIKLVNGMVF